MNIMENKKANMPLIMIFIVFLVVILIGAFFLLQSLSKKPFLEIDKFFDINGNEISTGTQSVIGGIEGVKFITLKISVENKDNIPLTLFVKSITPPEITVPSNTITVDVGKTNSWITDLIDIEPYEGTIQDFCVTVESESIPALREPSESSGCISIQVDPNPSANFDVSLDSMIGDGNINPGCTENWQCSEWSSCSNSIQTRTCTDLNFCETTQNKPEQQQSCQTSFQTNAIDGNYRDRSVWIDFGNGQYSYSGYSTFNCDSRSAGDVVETTPEGYKICTRNGYDLSSRVYLDDGRGNLFKP